MEIFPIWIYFFNETTDLLRNKSDNMGKLLGNTDNKLA